MTNMSRGRGTPWYGKLQTESLPSEVKAIWYSRDDELPELPRHRWSWELQDDMSLVEDRNLLFKILVDAPLTDREMMAIRLIAYEECTLDESAKALDCTRERARQIYMKGMRKLRAHQVKITGEKVYSIDCEVYTWRAYLAMTKHRRSQ
jgi:DNA-directed RNA polymerase specialized sigma24 family protein